MKHYNEDELTLYYYGEGRRRADIERHLGRCAECAGTYRDISGTLAMIAAPEVPERGDQYGLEVWQRIRPRLQDEGFSGFSRFSWFVGLSNIVKVAAFAGAAAVLVLAAFVAGRTWNRPGPAPAATTASSASTPADQKIAETSSNRETPSRRILITSVADHLDRSERVLTDIMNAPASGDISMTQRWADDLLAASRLYRQDAVDAGEQSVATVLDDLERSLLEIVHSPSRINAADLEQIRRRIDAAALLFKVRVMSDELRQRELQPSSATPQTSSGKVS